MIEDKYFTNLDAQDKRWYDYLVKDNGGITEALDFILKGLDCSVIYKDGSRPMMTINYAYRTDISGFLYLLDKISSDKVLTTEYTNKLIALHEKNLSFEETNKPVYYSAKSRKVSRSSSRTAKTKDLFTGAETQIDVGGTTTHKGQDNRATRKAKALKDKSISFAFNNFKINK